jgi:ABC-2 type transport system ATP-binding protein
LELVGDRQIAAANQSGIMRRGVSDNVTALQCRDVTHHFKTTRALAEVSLDVRSSEVFGLLGPNGAGKTTLIRVVNTLLPLQSGSVTVFGFDVRREATQIRRLLGYVPQMLSIEAALTGRENVTWFARLFDVPRRERAERVQSVLDAMGLADAADRLAATYSGGMVRRLELAQALVNRPALLVLDEPTVGLDPVARDSVWDRVDELRRSTGMTVLLTTHYMEEADSLCDRVALLHLGTVRAVGSPEDLRAELGPDATLEDVFRHHTGADLTDNTEGGLREIRRSRRTAARLG